VNSLRKALRVTRLAKPVYPILLFVSFLVMIAPVLGDYVAKSGIPQSAQYMHYYDMKVDTILQLSFYGPNNSEVMPTAYTSFSFYIDLVSAGYNLSSSNGFDSAYNMTDLRSILLTDNLYSSGGMPNGVMKEVGNSNGILLGGAYDKLFGYFVQKQFSYYANLGGNGSFSNPATGSIVSDISSGYLSDGYLAYNVTTYSELSGTVSYIIGTTFPSIRGYAFDLLGGTPVIRNATGWLSDYYNTNAGGFDVLSVTTLMSLEKTNIGFVPYYKGYITAGILVSLVPIGFTGVLYLGERREWFLRNSIAFAFIWVIIGILLVYSGLIIYY
jgi:hypothetical protein